ncbi:sialate:O-sulfotransferase 1-like [Mytilus galloprovincialis]|uniref:sialate:O-sulfotransferase 1-like n=1 Tax=Mytilus galloprovincialis TaxID=29158 RepID=UPI003F7C9048
MWIQFLFCCIIAFCSCEKNERFLESDQLSKGGGVLLYILQKLEAMQAAQTSQTETINHQKKQISDLEKRQRELKHTINTYHPLSKDGYMGCFKDDRNRHLKYRIANLSQTTLLKCKRHCHGFKYTGLQSSNACTCGNTLINPAYPRVPESECNRRCPGESNRMCGANWRNSIYRV